MHGHRSYLVWLPKKGAVLVGREGYDKSIQCLELRAVGLDGIPRHFTVFLEDADARKEVEVHLGCREHSSAF